MRVSGLSSVLVPLLCIPLRFVVGSVPISDPTLDYITHQDYNMIDVDPSCFYRGYCPMFPPGGELSVFPNSEEKFQQILHNLHRMHPNNSLYTPLGRWLYGANTARPSFFAGGEYCGSTDLPSTINPRKPIYWYSDANHMARFKQWDENTCDQSWYDKNGESAHSTCKWGLQEITVWGHEDFCTDLTTAETDLCTTPIDRCSMMEHDGSCGFDARSIQFNWDDKDSNWFDTEGICGGSSCLQDPGHCEPIFANRYDYVGKGFVAGMNGACGVYNRGAVEKNYLLPSAAHFDERVRIAEADLDAEGRHFNLMLEYHDDNETQRAAVCYALYDAKATPMTVYVAKGGYPGRWLGEGEYDVASFSLMFLERFAPPTQCEPYAFLCRSDQGNLFRLPQDERYYFGTDWVDWSWTDYANDYGLECKEQHYFYDGTQWLVNGGPTRRGDLTKQQIWYYARNGDVDAVQCIGCGENNVKLEALQCLEMCIRDDIDPENCDCEGWTREPTSPSEAPSRAPSREPTSPSEAPSRAPTVEGYTYPPTLPSTAPTMTTATTVYPSLASEVYMAPATAEDGSNVGGVVAGVLCALLCIAGVLGWAFWRHRNGKPLLSALVLTTSTSAEETVAGSVVQSQMQRDNAKMHVSPVAEDGKQHTFPTPVDTTQQLDVEAEEENEKTPLSQQAGDGNATATNFVYE